MVQYLPLWVETASKVKLEGMPLTPEVHVCRDEPSSDELDEVDVLEVAAGYAPTHVQRNRSQRTRQMRVWVGPRGVDFTQAEQWPSPWITEPPMDYTWLQESTNARVASQFAAKVGVSGAPWPGFTNGAADRTPAVMGFNNPGARAFWAINPAEAGARWVEVLKEVFGIVVPGHTVHRTMNSNIGAWAGRLWTYNVVRPLEEEGFTVLSIGYIGGSHTNPDDSFQSVCVSVKFPMTNQTRGVRAWAWGAGYQSSTMRNIYQPPETGWGVQFTSIDSGALCDLLTETHPYWSNTVGSFIYYNGTGDYVVNKGFFANEFVGSVADEGPVTILGQEGECDTENFYLDVRNSGAMREAGVVALTMTVIGVPAVAVSYQYLGEELTTTDATTVVSGIRGFGTVWKATAFVDLQLVSDSVEAAKLEGRTVFSYCMHQPHVVPENVYAASSLGLAAALAEYDGLAEVLIEASGGEPAVTMEQVVNRLKGKSLGAFHYHIGGGNYEANEIARLRVTGAASDVIEARNAANGVINPVPSLVDIKESVATGLVLTSFVAPANAAAFAALLDIDVSIFEGGSPTIELPKVTADPLKVLSRSAVPAFDRMPVEDKNTLCILANAIKPDAFSYLVASVTADAARAMKRYRP